MKPDRIRIQLFDPAEIILPLAIAYRQFIPFFHPQHIADMVHIPTMDINMIVNDL